MRKEIPAEIQIDCDRCNTRGLLGKGKFMERAVVRLNFMAAGDRARYATEHSWDLCDKCRVALSRQIRLFIKSEDEQ